MEKLKANNVFDTLLRDTMKCIEAWDRGNLANVASQIVLIEYVLNEAKRIGKQQLWENQQKE